MKLKFNIQRLLFLLITLTAYSCDDFLEPLEEAKVTNQNFWTSEQDAESALNGLQDRFRSTFGSYEMLSRDRGCIFDYTTGSRKDMCDNNLQATIERSDARIIWTYEYMTIAHANLILDNIHRVSLQEDRYNFYVGQALGIRAYSYFYILRTWGDAPWVTASEDVGEKARTPWQDIADYILDDLQKVTKLLPVAAELKYADGTPIVSKQYFSRGTAYALMAHIYAWKGALNNQPELFPKAIEAATEAINNGGYGLVESPFEVSEQVMHGNTVEGILELDYDVKNNEYKAYGGYIAGVCQRWPIQKNTTPQTARNARISNDLVYRLYPDKNDKRREAYFYKLDSMANVSTNITKGGAYIIKWKHPVVYEEGLSAGRMKTYDENEILLRLPDIILLRAELLAKTGDTGGAIADLNTIRQRAGAADYSSAEGDLQKAIALERDRELLLEASIRYWDKVRNGTFREDLYGKFKTLTDEDVRNGALYLPVASQAFVNNPLMRQTPYWNANGYNN